MPRRGFYPGGSTQPNRSFDHDLDCRDLHAFGNLVCNGEQRIGGKSIADTVEAVHVEAVHVEVKDVASHGEMLVPVTNSAPGATTPADHPSRGGLVMVNVSDDGKMYFSRENNVYNTALQEAQEKHNGAVAARAAIEAVVPTDPVNNTTDLTNANGAVDNVSGSTKFNEGRDQVKTAISTATTLASSKTAADGAVATLNTAKTPSAITTSTGGHGPFEWVAVN